MKKKPADRKDSLMGEDFPDGRYTITVDVKSGNVFGSPRALTQLLARVRADELELALDELTKAVPDWRDRPGILRHAKSLKHRAASFRRKAAP